MQTFKNINLVNFLMLNLILYLTPSISQPIPISFCGKTKIQTPFSIENSTESSSPVNKLLICKSQKLYFRTSLGLFEVSAIDYKAKTIIISHTYCSSSINFISPSLLTAGFPSAPQSNSLLLFNCQMQKKPMSPFLHNCTTFHGCKTLSEKQSHQQPSCWIIHDSEKMEIGFDPKDLNCSHYRRVYRDSASTDFSEEFKVGTVISYDIPDHVPNVCDECAKPQGNCGAGLRCLCHPKQCRDKVISKGASLGVSILPLLFFTILVISRY